MQSLLAGEEVEKQPLHLAWRSKVVVESLYSTRNFFFSSRRRHTRLQGDWSSDVCSSDLTAAAPAGETESEEEYVPRRGGRGGGGGGRRGSRSKIGRASCRERV